MRTGTGLFPAIHSSCNKEARRTRRLSEITEVLGVRRGAALPWARQSTIRNRQSTIFSNGMLRRAVGTGDVPVVPPNFVLPGNGGRTFAAAANGANRAALSSWPRGGGTLREPARGWFWPAWCRAFSRWRVSLRAAGYSSRSKPLSQVYTASPGAGRRPPSTGYRVPGTRYPAGLSWS